MSLSTKTARVLISLGYDLEEDFLVSQSRDGIISFQWYSQSARPTDQDINDYANDIKPLPNGQLFSVWQAEHGGDAIQTVKRKVTDQFKDAVNGRDPLTLAILAIVDKIADLHSVPRATARQQVLDRMKEIVDET